MLCNDVRALLLGLLTLSACPGPAEDEGESESETSDGETTATETSTVGDGDGDPGDGDGDPGDGDGDPGDGDPGDGDPGDGDPGDGDGDPCPAGTQGCPCDVDTCDPGLNCVDGLCAMPSCGDGIVDMGEGCDDGDQNDDTGACKSDCTPAECGDGFVWAGVEDCDDGNLDNNDGCSDACVVQAVVQITAGERHTCALTNTGAVRCWGEGANGRLGYANSNDIGDDEHPSSAGDVDVGGVVVQITAGSYHTCALLDTGAVRCWGDGYYGKLGYGNTLTVGDDETPASFGDIPLGGDAIQIDAGTYSTCAVLDTNAVRCWGRGSYGRLGYGNTNDIGDNESPASAGDVDIGGPVAEVGVGYNMACARLVNGAVRCWGYGNSAGLGYANGSVVIGDDEAPASAGDVDLAGTVSSLALGQDNQACVIYDDGALRCWGESHDGNLGYANTSHVGDDETPGSVGFVIVGDTVSSVETGRSVTCALLDSQDVRCWGFGSLLGYASSENIGDDETPSSAGPVQLGGPVADVSVGWTHTCAVLTDGTVRCWGAAYSGMLGYANLDQIGDDELPDSVGPVQVF